MNKGNLGRSHPSKASAEAKAPKGYRFLYQRLDAVTREEALRDASRIFGYPPSSLRLMKGHFDPGSMRNPPTKLEEFRNYGWIVFVSKEATKALRKKYQEAPRS